MPDNVGSWQIFNNDAHINIFLHGKETFGNKFFEGSSSKCHEICPKEISNKDTKMLQLKGNKILKGLVTLETLFDRKDSPCRNIINEIEKTKLTLAQKRNQKWSTWINVAMNLKIFNLPNF